MSDGQDLFEGDDPLTFLVVEDEPAVRTAIVRALTSLGACDSVGTFSAAQLTLTARRFDALVLDVMLPGGSGLNLVEHARRRSPAIAILVLTGSADHDVIARTHELGVRYLLKPFAPHHLELFAEDVRARRDARERRTLVTLERWTEDYDLSPTEAELLALGARGVPREEFSQLRGVRPDTIRKQIQMLIRRTGDDTFESAVNGLLREALEEPT